MNQTIAYEEFFERFYPGNAALKVAVENSAEVKANIIMDINVWFKTRDTNPQGLEQFMVRVRDEFEMRNPQFVETYIEGDDNQDDE